MLCNGLLSCTLVHTSACFNHRQQDRHEQQSWSVVAWGLFAILAVVKCLQSCLLLLVCCLLHMLLVILLWLLPSPVEADAAMLAQAIAERQVACSAFAKLMRNVSSPCAAGECRIRFSADLVPIRLRLYPWQLSYVCCLLPMALCWCCLPTAAAWRSSRALVRFSPHVCTEAPRPVTMQTLA